MTQTIIRARRRRRFVIVDQSAVEDARLSWAARGLLAYLLSRPDDWRVLVRDLKRRGDLGRDGIYKLLQELRSVGYVSYQRLRDRQGRLRGGTYYVSEVPGPPHPDSPDAVRPDAVRPDTAPPDRVRPDALLKTDLDQERKRKRIPTTTKDGSGFGAEAPPVEFAHWVPGDLRDAATRLIRVLDTTAAQVVVDEWAGIMAAGGIKRSPIGYLGALVARMQTGSLAPKMAAEVAAARQRGNIRL